MKNFGSADCLIRPCSAEAKKKPASVHPLLRPQYYVQFEYIYSLMKPVAVSLASMILGKRLCCTQLLRTVNSRESRTISHALQHSRVLNALVYE